VGQTEETEICWIHKESFDMVTRYRLSILFLAFTLLCSVNAMAQWQGANTGPSGSAAVTTDPNTVTQEAGNPANVQLGLVPVPQDAAFSYTFNQYCTTSAGTNVNGPGACTSYLTATPGYPLNTPNYDPNTFLPSTIYNGDGLVSNGAGGWDYHTDTVTCGGRCHPASKYNPAIVSQAEVFPSNQPVTAYDAMYGCAQVNTLAGMPYAVEAGENPISSMAYCGVIDYNGYMLTGHKNVLRKVVPGGWNGPDGLPFATTDPYGDVYNWATGTVNGTPLAYLDGDWMMYPDSAVLSGVTLTTGGVGGSSGLLKAELGGQFGDCARCHTTGWRPDALGPEPTTFNAATSTFTKITDAQFPRGNVDGYVAPGGSVPTSSWYLTGVQCERCHDHSSNDSTACTTPSSQWPKYGGQTETSCDFWLPAGATTGGVDGKGHQYSGMRQPVNAAATELCIECHRGEDAPTMAPAGGKGAINISQSFSLGSAHNQGQTFLNSPHAQYTGTLTQNAQDSPDLSVNFNGTYGAYFPDWGEGLGNAPNYNNAGCTGCHNPHYSATPAAMLAGSRPLSRECTDCHSTTNALMASTMKHPTGVGTPFPSGMQKNNITACIICHMQAAPPVPVAGTPQVATPVLGTTIGETYLVPEIDPQIGSAAYHVFRINPSASYYTFNTTTKAPNTSPDGAYSQAVWLDVDIACGQCHGGGSGNGVNPYGIALPKPTPPIFTRAFLAAAATGIHNSNHEVTTVATPTFSVPAGTYSKALSVYISDATSGSTICYQLATAPVVTTAGTCPTGSTPMKSAGRTITVAASETVYAVATMAGANNSALASAAYAIVTKPADPILAPGPGIYTGTQTVTLTAANSTAIYYTTNGSTPTAASTLYTAGGITVAASETIYAIAVNGSKTSGVEGGVYRIVAPPAPTFSIAPYPTIYKSAQTLNLSDAAPVTMICYTVNGAIPVVSAAGCTTGSPYNANWGIAIPVGNSVVRAVAGGPGFASSPVVTGIFVVE
jgi:predicted CXXCH cytochrome family protein